MIPSPVLELEAHTEQKTEHYASHPVCAPQPVGRTERLLQARSPSSVDGWALAGRYCDLNSDFGTSAWQAEPTSHLNSLSRRTAAPLKFDVAQPGVGRFRRGTALIIRRRAHLASQFQRPDQGSYTPRLRSTGISFGAALLVL